MSASQNSTAYQQKPSKLSMADSDKLSLRFGLYESNTGMECEALACDKPGKWHSKMYVCYIGLLVSGNPILRLILNHAAF